MKHSIYEIYISYMSGSIKKTNLNEVTVNVLQNITMLYISILQLVVVIYQDSNVPNFLNSITIS